MSCDVGLMEALAIQLASDTGAGSLVALTGHNATNPDRGIRIGRMKPPLRERSPYVGIALRSSRLPSADDVDVIKQGRFTLTTNVCGDTADLTVLRIGDRIEGLLKGEVGPSAPGGVPPASWYWDISSPEVRVLSLRFFSRSRIFEEDDTDIRSQNILADVIWHCVPCP